jgi:hypothetical protein
MVDKKCENTELMKMENSRGQKYFDVLERLIKIKQVCPSASHHEEVCGGEWFASHFGRLAAKETGWMGLLSRSCRRGRQERRLKEYSVPLTYAYKLYNYD